MPPTRLTPPHWARTLRFLAIVTRAWPAWLDEQGLMNPAARQIRLLRAQAEAWESQAPDDPVWWPAPLAASRPSPACCAWWRGCRQGQVVLPGLDRDCRRGLGRARTAHPQAGLRELLKGLGATRDDCGPGSAAGIAGAAGAICHAQPRVAARRRA